MQVLTKIGLKILCVLATLFLSVCLKAQNIPEPDITFDFNDHSYNEKHGRIHTKPVGVSLVSDRFGNKKSALYLHGHTYSYLNLGTSNLLKPKKATISLWVKLERKVEAGQGYEGNPIIETKNSHNPNFYDAYTLFYDFKSNRFMIFSSKEDSIQQAGINSTDTVIFNKWYHLVFTYDNDHLAFYVNGKIEESSKKGFETNFLEGDSVVVGNTANVKNSRSTRGIVDDIYIYHRVLSGEEIEDLYNAPNPNHVQNIINAVLKYAGILLGIVIIIFIVIYRYRLKLKRQKEYYELNNRIGELEIKVIKAQMNPHFISNCLVAIQNLIYEGQIEKSGQYIAKFSFFLRKVLDYSDKTFITLEEELEIVKLNIELEQLRFKTGFSFNLSVGQNIKASDIMIPSLITQPFIENAIWHGLLPLKDLRKPELIINVYSQNENVFIEITDNGVGRKLEQENKNSKGTKLVTDKLESINKLMNSSSYGLEIIDLFNSEGLPEGTKIRIRLSTNVE
jgi:hypothetical protein